MITFAKRYKMSKKKSGLLGNCPECTCTSDCVKGYGVRLLQHFIIGEETTKSYPYVTFRCMNSECIRKTFRQYEKVSGEEELEGRSRYTQSSKRFVANKLLTQHVSYQGLHKAIQSDFGTTTAVSSLYTWVQKQRIEDVAIVEPIVVLHTDEKHPSKKSKSLIKNTL